ncbi:periplasmic nitrate reductase, NapE protein [Ruegeria sp. WL0004]|uniref:Periplasmic nitrate reductase, NapE protein n=1 Tax=Ruegeria marisflavi TaxID=2984152 RepID=A0ABT2WU97_9RHOB|nr:periplasmic nitrate reductase, NapE protein [Ruegeria sp. WL0004]MCU9839474.1 periplasmic nitrate reductase, NapE protein [Ruegeria sp. WL0004]
MRPESSPATPYTPAKRDERRAFIALAVFLAPALAVAIVGGLGFIIWMSQLIYGPPAG